MSVSPANCNPLFGMLALELEFITREQLLAAMSAWIVRKDLSLGQLLLEQQALNSESLQILESLVEEHLRRHGNDLQRSLAALGAADSRPFPPEEAHESHTAASTARGSDVSASPTDPEATLTWHAHNERLYGPRFLVLRSHAHGGLGEVYVARDGELHREVALKQLQPRHADDPNSRERFIREAEITGGLEHPGVVPVYALGASTDGRPFYVMRLIRGETLKEAIEQAHRKIASGPFRRDPTLLMRRLLASFISVCQTIEYAHSRGVLHRDIKPSNIMLGKYGEAIVVDWGLAKALGRSERYRDSGEDSLAPTSGSNASATRLGSRLGTLAYMSPEQFEGRNEELDPASDVYSLGATLYHILTGKPPVCDATQEEDKFQGDPAAPRQLNRRIAAGLEAICLKAMELRPADRYPSAKALAEDLERFLANEPVAAWQPSLAVRLHEWCINPRRIRDAGYCAVFLGMIFCLWNLIGVGLITLGVIPFDEATGVKLTGAVWMLLATNIAFYIPTILIGFGVLSQKRWAMALGLLHGLAGVAISILFLAGVSWLDYGVFRDFRERFPTFSMCVAGSLFLVLMHSLALYSHRVNDLR